MSAKSWDSLGALAGVSTVIQLWAMVPFAVLTSLFLGPVITILGSWFFDRPTARSSARALAFVLGGVVVLAGASLGLVEPNGHLSPEIWTGLAGILERVGLLGTLAALSSILAGVGLLGTLAALSLIAFLGKLLPPAPGA